MSPLKTINLAELKQSWWLFPARFSTGKKGWVWVSGSHNRRDMTWLKDCHFKIPYLLQKMTGHAEARKPPQQRHLYSKIVVAMGSPCWWESDSKDRGCPFSLLFKSLTFALHFLVLKDFLYVLSLLSLTMFSDWAFWGPGLFCPCLYVHPRLITLKRRAPGEKGQSTVAAPFWSDSPRLHGKFVKEPRGWFSWPHSFPESFLRDSPPFSWLTVPTACWAVALSLFIQGQKLPSWFMFWFPTHHSCQRSKPNSEAAEQRRVDWRWGWLSTPQPVGSWREWG